MSSYAFSAALAVLCFLALLAWCGWLMWQNRRDAETDEQLRRGLRELERQNCLAFRAREHKGYPERSEL